MKCGIIKKDPETGNTNLLNIRNPLYGVIFIGEEKLKLYREDNGNLKGDALVSSFFRPSNYC